MNFDYKIDVIIPTYRPGSYLRTMVKKLLEQHYGIHKVIIINTEETYLDKQLLDGLDKVEIHHIKKEEFNHGLSRNYGASFSKADILVFMTQDAMPVDKYLIDELVRPFKDDKVYLTYARQLPNKKCKYVEKYVRNFNYPACDIEKSKADIETMGIKTLFCSDVCSAYRRDKFMELGQFPKTDFNEDTVFAYKVIEAGKKVYYASNANVIHSHNYSYFEQLKRNFDIGRSQKQFAYVFESVKSESEGIRMVKSAMRYLIRNKKWYMIPDLIVSSGFKLIGYKLGKMSDRLPSGLIRHLSMNGR